MAQQYHNPFAALRLIAPVEQRKDYDQYCHRQNIRNINVDRKPFLRMVDFWFAGLLLAVRKQLTPVDLGRQKTFRFVEGSIFDRDSWRVQAVMLIAIATEGNVEVVRQPADMITIANGLAAAGVPHVVEMLEKGNQEPIWNLSEALVSLLKSDIHTEEHPNRTKLSDVLKEKISVPNIT